jgi:hypothetical protein
MKSQYQLCESARRKAADKAHGFAFLLGSRNPPTLEEIEKLQAKRPALWSGYPKPSK